MIQINDGNFTIGNDGVVNGTTINDDGSAVFSGGLFFSGGNLTITVSGAGDSIGRHGHHPNVTATGGVTGTGNLILNNEATGGGLIASAGTIKLGAAPAITTTGENINNIGTITNNGNASASTGLDTINGNIGTNVTGVYEDSTTSPLALAGGNNAFTNNGSTTFGLNILAGTVIAYTNNPAVSADPLGAGAVTLGNTTGTSPAALLAGCDFLNLTNPILLATNSNHPTLALGLTAGLANDSYATFSGSVTGTNNLTINDTSTGTLYFTTGAINNAGTVTNAGTGAGPAIISSNLGSNVTDIVQNSPTSSLTLSGTNSFTGTVTITAGELGVGANANLGSTGNALIFNGGILQITGTALTSAASGKIGTHPYTINSNVNVGFDINNPSNIFTISDALTQGTGGFTKLGAGTLVLTNTNTYQGATLINAGTLQLGNGGTTGTLNPSSAIVVNSTYGAGANNSLTIPSTFAIDRSNTVTQGTDFSGSGIGTLSLTGNTTSGSTTISGLSSTALLADGMSVTGAGIAAGSTIATIASATSITLNNKATATGTAVALTFTETGDLANIGAGTTILTATNTYSGTTSVYSGVLQIGNGGANGTFGTGPVTVAGGNLVFDSSSTLTVPNVIQNLTTAGSGSSAPVTTVSNPGHDMVQENPSTGLQAAVSAINMHDTTDTNGQLETYHWGATGSDNPQEIPVVAPFNPIAVQAVGPTTGSGALFYLTTQESTQAPTGITVDCTYTAGSTTVTLTSGTTASLGIAPGEVVEGAGIFVQPGQAGSSSGPAPISPTGTFVESVSATSFTLTTAPTGSGTELLIPALANLEASGIGGVQIVSGGGGTVPNTVPYTQSDVGKILTVAQGLGTFSIGANGSLTPNQENYDNPNVTPAQLIITQVNGGSGSGAITGVALYNAGTYQAYSPVIPGDQTYPTNTFVGSISGTTLTVSQFVSGTPLVVGMTIGDSTSNENGNITTGVTISAQVSGTTGGVGTYTLSGSMTIASETMTGTSAVPQTLTTATGTIPIESNMLSPALSQPTAVDISNQSGYGSGLGDIVTSAYEMTSQHSYSANLTGDTTAGSPVINNVSIINLSGQGATLVVGMAVDDDSIYGLGGNNAIPLGATIVSIGAGGASITLSEPATATTTGDVLDAWNQWTSQIDPNTIATGGSGYTNNETVVALGGVTAAAGAPLLGTVTVNGSGAVTGFVASDAVNNGYQGAAGDSDNWYNVLPTVPCPVTGGTGTGALFNLPCNDVESGPTGIAIATIENSGAGYRVGDVLTVGAPAGVTPVGTAATLTVTSVGANGAITGVNVATPGSYTRYNPATLFYVAPVPGQSGGSTGSGCILSWQALQTSVPDNASSSMDADVGIVNGGGYAAGDLLVVTGGSWKDASNNTVTWSVAPILQVTQYNYSASGASFTYNIVNTPVPSIAGEFPPSSVAFNVFPLGYTPNTVVAGPNTYYGAGLNGGVAVMPGGATVNFSPQSFGLTPGTVIQEGSGTTILTGQNSYSGATSVNNGTLQVDGSIADSSSVTVASGATLSGLGTVPSTTVNGTLQPGDPGVAGTLNTDLTFGSGSTLNINEDTVSSNVVVSEVIVTGTASLTGSSLSLSFADTVPSGKTYTIVHTTGGLGGTTFTSLPNGSTLSDSKGEFFQINYSTTDVTITSISTPTTTSFSDNGITGAPLTAGGSIEQGQNINFTVTVASSSGTPTGTVQLEDAANGNALVGSAQTLVGGTVNFTSVPGIPATWAREHTEADRGLPPRPAASTPAPPARSPKRWTRCSRCRPLAPAVPPATSSRRRPATRLSSTLFLTTPAT